MDDGVYPRAIISFHFMAMAQVSEGEYENPEKISHPKRKVIFMIEGKSSINWKYQEIYSLHTGFSFCFVLKPREQYKTMVDYLKAYHEVMCILKLTSDLGKEHMINNILYFLNRFIIQCYLFLL